jgi:propanol-preferring alcohol dehydrogenase
LGAGQTILPGLLALRKGGRQLQLGKTGQEDREMVALPVDAMLLQELTFIGSLGCPVTSYPGLLSLIVSGKLNPRRLVSRIVAVEDVNDVLRAMTTYRTRGFNVINVW